MVDQPHEGDDALNDSSETPEEFDQRVYAGLMRGDQDAWAEFYDYYGGRLDWYFEKSDVYDDRDREDLFNETMEAIYRSLDRYDPDHAPFRNWVYGVARNVMLRHQRIYSRLYAHEEGGDDALELAAFQAGDALEEETAGEVDPRLALLRKALSMLPEPKRKILKMRASRTATWAELAQELDIGTSAAKMRHQRALEELKQLVDTLGAEQD